MKLMLVVVAVAVAAFDQFVSVWWPLSDSTTQQVTSFQCWPLWKYFSRRQQLLPLQQPLLSMWAWQYLQQLKLNLNPRSHLYTMPSNLLCLLADLGRDCICVLLFNDSCWNVTGISVFSLMKYASIVLLDNSGVCSDTLSTEVCIKFKMKSINTNIFKLFSNYGKKFNLL